MNESSTLEANQERTVFGYEIAGPILADMLQRLHAQLRAADTDVIFFCARGGLVLHRTLELFMRHVGLELQTPCTDFMVSRLTAFRTAFQLNPTAVRSLIEIEFTGRGCGEAALALADIDTCSDATWDTPFSMPRFVQLTECTAIGKRVRANLNEQANLLRRYIDYLRGSNTRVMLCDTGVFGSILRYLQIGVPEVDWRLTLLFRANYKRIATPHFDATVGAVSEANTYLPWRPATAPLLYWPLIEAILEPALPSARSYVAELTGRVVSNLEVPGWQDRLEPPAESILAGACRYLSELTPQSLFSIETLSLSAWRKLRHKIAFPSTTDVALLAAGRRHLDFGTDYHVEFSSRSNNKCRSLREKLSAAEASMWPEGEIRKQLPRTAGLFQVSWELVRFVRALSFEARNKCH